MLTAHVFPPSYMVGEAKFTNSFTSAMVTCLEHKGWRVKNFSYLRSLWSGETLIINWPEYFGRFGKGQFSGFSITPTVLILVIAKLFRVQTKVVLVHHNLPGQRFRSTIGTRILYAIADINISLGKSPRLASALRRDTTVVAHPAYSILTKSKEKKYSVIVASDKSRTVAELNVASDVIYWSRDEVIAPHMMRRESKVILGKLCEFELQNLISEATTFLIPWPKVLNSGLGILSLQLGTRACFLDKEYVQEANRNGIGVSFWDSNQQAEVGHPMATSCIYSGIADPEQFNQTNFCSPLVKMLEAPKHD